MKDSLGFRLDLVAMLSPSSTERLAPRRTVLGALGGAMVLAACGDSGSSSSSGGGGAGASGGGGAGQGGMGTGAAGGAGAGECSTIPTETEGPYPGDGSNGPNVLSLSDVVRRDIRSSIGEADGTAAGTELTVTMTIVDADGCTPLAGRAVYLWHCDQNGDYSMYSDAIADENYLRGVQVSDADGNVTFTTIFPGCYDGRWPHIHFEVYESLAAATSSSSPHTTSQIALPSAACGVAYEATGYETSADNFAQANLANDNVFGDDGAALQLAEVSAAGAGYLATLTVAV